MTYADKGDIDQAILEYQNAVKIDPTVPNLYHNLGNAYGSKGDPGTAEKYYLKAIQVDPNFWFSYVSLLKLYQATGQKDKFDKLLSVTKQRFPNLGK
jgi:Tfp pilus assembly protein PilF